MTEHNGVQARVKEVSPKALFIRCYAHSLNLVLVHAIQKNRMTLNYFGTLESLYCFVRNSIYRNQLFMTLQSEFEKGADDEEGAPRSLSLKKLCETRWACRIQAITAVQRNYEVLIQLLERVRDESSNGKAVSDAVGLLTQLRTFSFILCTNVLAELLQHTHIISKYLQSEQLDLHAAISTIEAVVKVLNDKRSETHFKLKFDESKQICEANDIELPSIETTRQRSVSKTRSALGE